MSHAATQVGKLRRNLAVAGFGAFTAFFLLRVLQMWGVVEALREEFEQMVRGPVVASALLRRCWQCRRVLEYSSRYGTR